ncbi:metallophosphoesterase [Acinetobacter sp. c1-l78]|uniref:metallophosphoesterase family protein n=1 Tax=Acinetobacter sp. c1-l78 TaxID=3342803 RepID=UPI0035B9CA04
MLRVAIFADIHGKFLLPFKLVEHYQNLYQEKIDLILQCGDMGAFPDKNKMDKATLRHALNDRDELGFSNDFVKSHAEIATYLDKLNINMYCVRGNHEDHAFLDELEYLAKLHDHPYFPIDIYQRIWVCRTGVPFILQNKNEQLSVVGIGRIGDKKGRHHPQFIQNAEREQLKKLGKKSPDIDILITHDKASESKRGYGAFEIEDILDKIAFKYHFHGHTGEDYHVYLAENGITHSVKIKELEFNREGKLEYGCMIILEKYHDKHGEQLNFKVVALNDIIQFMHKTWHYL